MTNIIQVLYVYLKSLKTIQYTALNKSFATPEKAHLFTQVMKVTFLNDMLLENSIKAGPTETGKSEFRCFIYEQSLHKV